MSVRKFAEISIFAMIAVFMSAMWKKLVLEVELARL